MSKEIEMVTITKIVKENDSHKTFYFNKKIEMNAGQFIMAWLPEIDEKPFSPSALGKQLGITVQKRGNFTSKMFELKKGDKIGIRGPFGHGFETKGIKKAIIIGGGCGTGPLRALTQQLQKNKTKIDFIIGARNKKLLLFENELKKTTNLYITTDDGSKGEKKYPHELLKELLEKKEYNVVYCCGPEIMMKMVLGVCLTKKVKCQLSLERHMKCAMGLCAQCMVGKHRVCVEGPVFDSEKLKKLKEFGRVSYDEAGKKEIFGN